MTRPMNAHDAFEMAVNRALGDAMREDAELCRQMWSALANVEWTHENGDTADYSFRAAGDLIAATSMLKNLDDEIFMRTDEEATILQVAIGFHPRHSEFEIFNLLVEDENGFKATIRTLTPEGQFTLSNRLNELSMEAKSGKKYKWREFWRLKEAFNEVRHSYAITSHRSQGSSYEKVFVDLEDICLNRNRQECFRSLYVACTRQRQELHVA